MKTAKTLYLPCTALMALLVAACGAPDATEDLPSQEAAPAMTDTTAEQEDNTVTAMGACKSSPSSTNCNGKDPRAEGCDADAYTVATVYAGSNSLYIALRYSPSCRTNWTKVYTGDYSYQSMNGYVRRNDGAVYCYPTNCSMYSSVYAQEMYTNMVYAPTGSGYTAQACGGLGGWRYPSCTGYY